VRRYLLWPLCLVTVGCVGNMTVHHDPGDDDVGLDFDDDDDDDDAADDDDSGPPGDCEAAASLFDFEAGDDGFSHDGPDVGFADPWTMGAPDGRSCHSGESCWTTGLYGEYGDCEAGELLSPEVDLSACAGTGAAVTLRFWHWYQFEAGTLANYDGGTVQISPDGGQSWQIARPEPDYLGPIQGTYDECGTPPEIDGLPGWSAALGGDDWVEVGVEIDDELQTDAFRVRFLFGSDRGVVDEGWYIDDVEIAIE
jgi:hypothetical protein